ncbi:hypothetical protein [Micromonospora sp. DT227]
MDQIVKPGDSDAQPSGDCGAEDTGAFGGDVVVPSEKDIRWGGRPLTAAA